MRQSNTSYIVRNQEKDLFIETEQSTMSKPEEIYRRLLRITDKGNHAEVKRKKDGSLVIYEVKKNIIM